MPIDLPVEALAQRNDVVGLLMPWRFLLGPAVEPTLHAIEKMKPLDVEDSSAHAFFIGAEEHAGGKDALESLDEAAHQRDEVVGYTVGAEPRREGVAKLI